MPPTASPAQVYRFAAVEFDAGAFQLRVAGLPRHCPARVLRLLQLLCAAPGRLFQRDELIAALWPQRQLVSDESLDQVVFKLRTALDADAACLVTVRGAGLRLDAEVTATPSSVLAAGSGEGPGESHDDAAGTTLPNAAADSVDSDATLSDGDAALAVAAISAAPSERALPAQPPAPTRGIYALRRWHFALLLAGIIAVAGAFQLWRVQAQQRDAAALRAWGFEASQVHAARADTAERLRAALAADASGDRAQAQVTLTAIHNNDAQTPLPALLLSAWRAGAGDRAGAEQWLAAARPRVAASNDVETMTWLDLAQALAQGQSNAMLASLSALLERRTDAWILRHIRAQLRHQRAQPEAALEDLQRIAVVALTDRRLEDVLATRAALGDRAGAEAAYARLDARAQPVGHAAVGALLAWSAGDLVRARQGFAETAVLARRENRDDWVLRAELLAAALAFEAGDANDARQRIAEAAARARETRETLSLVDAELMLAQIAAAANERTDCQAALTRALAAAVQSGDAAWEGLVEVVALRLGQAMPALHVTQDSDLMSQGLATLRQARLALRDGERERATMLYRHAPAPLPLLSEEYAMLARDLELPWSLPQRPNPPSPPYFRLITSTLLARAAPPPT